MREWVGELGLIFVRWGIDTESSIRFRDLNFFFISLVEMSLRHFGPPLVAMEFKNFVRHFGDLVGVYVIKHFWHIILYLVILFIDINHHALIV